MRIWNGEREGDRPLSFHEIAQHRDRAEDAEVPKEVKFAFGMSLYVDPGTSTTSATELSSYYESECVHI